MRLTKATVECPHCDAKKHQIDGTEERALRIAREAMDRHIAEEHTSVFPSGSGDTEPGQS